MEEHTTVSYYSSREQIPLYLDVSDINKIIGCGRVKAYELANSKQFKTVRVGRNIKIPKDDFFCWLDKNTI
ncbi:helix-turn-helix domain-containing protein [Paenibacillus alba]|uniref:Helix-turn-helix domain-containing protein n=1 Tax=Paenibacillus alba TaxID=1197127 RepID=A0ABU6FY40_9BACL|nr:helix-turn-helix domain-containing protein [Paenibacillus alba]MEC0226823.1 helix-turn-helix domain-containing protein [Paenibacillus alba]